MWPRTSFFAQEAVVGYRHGPDDVRAGRRGVCFWGAPQIVYLVSGSGHSQFSRAQWIHLYGTPGGDVSILNVYAPTEVRARTALWEELSTSLPHDCKWILCGNWNVVECKIDKSTACGKIMSDGEKLTFVQLTSALKVEDAFSNTSPIKYSWDNKR
jgi:hypothetical protein